MVKKEIKSIILYLDSAAAIDYLTDEQAGILFKAVLRYGRDGQMLESSDTALTALFTMLCTQIDRDHKKYDVVNVMLRMPRKGMRNSIRKSNHLRLHAIACHRIRTHAIMIIIVIMTIRLTMMMITLTLLSSVTRVCRTILLRQSGRCTESQWGTWKF